MSEKDPQADSIISDEELDLELELDNTEDVEDLKLKLEEAREANRKINARAKIAEAKLKEKESQPTQTTEQKATQPISNPVLTAEDVEVRNLKAQGVSNDEIVYLKKLAAVNGTSIIEAQSDELFSAFKSKKEEQEKSEKSKLGASRGSSSVKREKDYSTPGLSDEEHKEIWKRQNS